MIRHSVDRTESLKFDFSQKIMTGHVEKQRLRQYGSMMTPKPCESAASSSAGLRRVGSSNLVSLLFEMSFYTVCFVLVSEIFVEITQIVALQDSPLGNCRFILLKGTISKFSSTGTKHVQLDQYNEHLLDNYYFFVPRLLMLTLPKTILKMIAPKLGLRKNDHLFHYCILLWVVLALEATTLILQCSHWLAEVIRLQCCSHTLWTCDTSVVGTVNVHENRPHFSTGWKRYSEMLF